MTTSTQTPRGLPERDRRHARTRAVSAALGALGLITAVAPDQVTARLGPGSPRPPRWIVRVLGARSVLQHALILTRPTRRAVQFGATLDGLHAASMLPAAAVWSRYARPASVSAGIAAVSALLQLAVLPPSDDRVHVPGDVEV